MPLGIVKDEDYERDKNGRKKEEFGEKPIPSTEAIRKEPVEVENGNDNLIEPVNITPSIAEFIAGGRGKGNTEVPQSIRRLIGESSIEEGSGAANAIGKFLGLSKSSVSAYAHSATSTATYNKPNEELADHLLNTRKRITKRAAGKLYKSLGVIDDDKLEKLSALEASTVAKNMSAIIKNMEPPDTKGTTVNGPVITFYAPQMVREELFETIVLNE